jgi:hypothetical protein
MNGGAEQAMKPTMKILSATVLGRRFSRRRPTSGQYLQIRMMPTVPQM